MLLAKGLPSEKEKIEKYSIEEYINLLEFTFKQNQRNGDGHN